MALNALPYQVIPLKGLVSASTLARNCCSKQTFSPSGCRKPACGSIRERDSDWQITKGEDEDTY
jgi:hypothetical protein